LQLFGNSGRSLTADLHKSIVAAKPVAPRG